MTFHKILYNRSPLPIIRGATRSTVDNDTNQSCFTNSHSSQPPITITLKRPH
ncbi:hypothetical protein Hanom_Chr01g00008931 [Helianthus anomalus]